MRTSRNQKLNTLLAVFCLINTVVIAQPKYASKKTKTIIEKMLKAHGGYDTWSAKPSVSYTHAYTGPHDPNDPWKSDEIVEQGSRRVFQDWPLDMAQIIYDGTDYYAVNWKRGNPPKFTAHLAYYFGNIPFMTQDDGVILSEPGNEKILEDPTSYLTVKMTFASGTGEASDDYYSLFIDPNTYTLKAIQYIVTYGALLDAFEFPAEVKFMGPFYKIYEEYTEVDGLKVPKLLTTKGTKGEDYGFHTYENWDFNKSFDEDKMEIPKEAEKDYSSSERKTM